MKNSMVMSERLKKDSKSEGIFMFVNAMIAIAIQNFSERVADPRPFLVGSFFFLFLMFGIFAWNRRENKLLFIGTWVVYVWLFYVWILA